MQTLLDRLSRDLERVRRQIRIERNRMLRAVDKLMDSGNESQHARARRQYRVARENEKALLANERRVRELMKV